MRHSTQKIYVFTAIASFTIMLLTACSGGGGGGTTPTSGGTTSTSGSSTSSVSSGGIEGFGSVIVNGVRFNTDSSEFEVENETSSSQDDLSVGMQVVVEGSIDDNGTTGTATRVRFEDNLEGPITSFTPSDTGLSKMLSVMGQTVRVESGVTFFDNSDPSFNFASLGPANVGNVVEVSGNDLPDGSIQATFIERKANDLASFVAANGELELKGSIANLTASTFTIGSLTIDYATASLFDLDNSPSGQLENGLPVEVKGTDLAGNVFTAATVEVKLNGLGINNIAKAEVEGIVTQLNANTQTFTVNGQGVNYANATFRGGLAEELVNGMKVEAEGPVAGGVLNATRISFKESIRFEANVATVSGNTLTLRGLPGITIQADSDITRMENTNGSGSLSAGNNLRVRARSAGNSGNMVATRLELRDADPEIRLIVQGPVDSFDSGAGRVTLLGNLVTVDTTTIENDEFEFENQIIGRNAFFVSLIQGDIVKARAILTTLAGDAKTWEAIEIEDENL